MVRKCPKNQCDGSYLRIVKETTNKKKEIICLKCQHQWSSMAKYTALLTVATTYELADSTEEVLKEKKPFSIVLDNTPELDEIKEAYFTREKKKYVDLKKQDHEIPAPEKKEFKAELTLERVRHKTLNDRKETKKEKSKFKPWTWF